MNASEAVPPPPPRGNNEVPLSSPEQNTAAANRTLLADEFRAGVTATLRSWSALSTAVEQQWGGMESALKAEGLRQHIYQVFPGFDGSDSSSSAPKLDVYDLEDNLAIYMEEEFSVVLEDESERQVADALFRMYEACMKGDVTLARQAVESARRAEAIKTAFPVQVQNTDDDDDDDDEMMDTSEMSVQQTAAAAAAQEYAAGSLFGAVKRVPSGPPKPVRQLGEAAPQQRKEQEVDDDGFATVQTKRRSRK